MRTKEEIENSITTQWCKGCGKIFKYKSQLIRNYCWKCTRGKHRFKVNPLSKEAKHEEENRN